MPSRTIASANASDDGKRMPAAGALERGGDEVGVEVDEHRRRGGGLAT